MHAPAKLLVAAAVLLLTTGCQAGGGGSQASAASSPTGTLLARGSFKAMGADVELDARGSGSDVTGEMAVSLEGQRFTVDLECSRNADGGVVWIGGDVTSSTLPKYAPEGTRTAIVLRRGSPVAAEFVFQMTDPRSSSCLAFFDDMLALGPVKDFEPIVGTVELAP